MGMTAIEPPRISELRVLRLLFVRIKIVQIHYSPYAAERYGKSKLLSGVFKVRACVLIVDDHAIIRKMLHALFEPEDMEVCEAENGAEGVQRAQELNPGLVILDLSMPVMNGLEAARALQLTMPHVPLLMFSNNSGAGIEKEARSAGIVAVISKSDTNASQQLVAQAKTLLGLEGADLQFDS
jgi:CheY-like chemotaxis protein